MGRSRYEFREVTPSERSEIIETLEDIKQSIDVLRKILDDEHFVRCIVCGKWFVPRKPHTRVCSVRCRLFHDRVITTLRSVRKQIETTRQDHRQLPVTIKLQKSVIYSIIYDLVQKGLLSPQIFGYDNPEHLPTPIVKPTNLRVKLFKFLFRNFLNIRRTDEGDLEPSKNEPSTTDELK